MKGFLLRSRQVSPYVAGLLGRLQLPCPRLAGLIVSFSSVCLGSSGLLRVAGAVFWACPNLGAPSLVCTVLFRWVFRPWDLPLGLVALSRFLPGLWNSLVPFFRLAGLSILSC